MVLRTARTVIAGTNAFADVAALTGGHAVAIGRIIAIGSPKVTVRLHRKPLDVQFPALALDRHFYYPFLDVDVSEGVIVLVEAGTVAEWGPPTSTATTATPKDATPAKSRMADAKSSVS